MTALVKAIFLDSIVRFGGGPVLVGCLALAIGAACFPVGIGAAIYEEMNP